MEEGVQKLISSSFVFVFIFDFVIEVNEQWMSIIRPKRSVNANDYASPLVVHKAQGWGQQGVG